MKVILYSLLFVCLSFSQGKALAIVLKAKGQAEVVRHGKTKKLKRGSRIYNDDLVKTKRKAYVALRFLDDKSLVRVRQNSVLKIQGKREGSSIVKNISVEAGNIFASITKQRRRFRVTTPTSVASVKGTVLECMYNPETGEHITVTHEGLVGVTVGGKEIDVKAGKLIIAKKDGTYEEREYNEETRKELGLTSIEDLGESKVDAIKIEFKGKNRSKNLNIKIIDNE